MSDVKVVQVEFRLPKRIDLGAKQDHQCGDLFVAYSLSTGAEDRAVDQIVRLLAAQLLLGRVFLRGDLDLVWVTPSNLCVVWRR